MARQSRVTRRQLMGGAAAALLGHGTAGRADAEGAPAPIVAGMSSPLSGPAAALGKAMRLGVEAAFALTNERGGVMGRSLRLVALDDAYDPERTARNVRSLIDESGVFSVLGNVGTPTAAVAVPIIDEKRVPFFGALTGAGLLRRTPPDRYVVNFRASYAQETAEMVRGIVRDLGIPPRRIALFTQDDAYGESGWGGAMAALKEMGLADPERLPHGRYPRNTSDVEDALARLLDPRISPEAVIMVGAYEPCAKFIRIARREGLRAVYANVSFVGSEALAAELGPAGEGVVVTQVVPHYDADLPLLREYRAAVRPADVNFVSLEGFIVGRTFAEALRLAGPTADRERFLDTLESGAPLDLGLGARYALSRDRHQLSDGVWPTYIRGGRFRPMTSWAEIGALR